MLFAPFAGASVVITNQTDYLGTNEAFTSGNWTTSVPLPFRNSAFAISAVNGVIWVAGGTGAGQGSTCATTGVQGFDTTQGTWSFGAAMPTATLHSGSGAINGIMYVVGGMTDCSTATTGVQAFDPQHNVWGFPFPHPLPFAAARMGVGVVNGILYSIGGYNPVANGSINTVEAYNPSTNTWVAKAAMPTARRDPVVCVVNGIIYAIGGWDPPNGLTTVEAFDPVANTWTTKAPMPTARVLGATGGVVNGIIYVMGGVKGSLSFQGSFSAAPTEAYDPATNTWSTAPEMPTSRYDLGAAVVNNTLYAIGGRLLETATVGQQFTYQITATSHPTSYNATGLPPGLSIDTHLGLISGKPTTVGNYQVGLSATSGFSTGIATLSLGVQPAPPSLLIVNSTCATGRTGQPFNFRILTSGGSLATHYSLSGLPDGLSGNKATRLINANGLPDGLDADLATGVISGTSAFDGNYIVQVTAIDGAISTSATVQLTFISDTTVPIITSAGDAAVVPGQPFFLRLSADVAANFSAVDGTLPNGLSITPETATTAILSGTYYGHQVVPDVIKKEPPCAIIQPTADNSNGTGTRPLNLFQAGVGGFSKSVNGYPLLQFVGVPNQSHDIESTTDLVHYTYVTTRTADDNGRFDFEDTTSGVFYRVRYPSNVNPSRGD